MITKLFHSLLDILFPSRCLKCGKEKSFLCDKCRVKIINPHFADLNKNGCEKVFSFLSYNNPAVKKLLWNLKYRHISEIAKILSEIILYNCTYFSTIDKKSYILIPVPISTKRKRQRGYNQSALIAEFISKKTGIVLINELLIKKKETIPQVETKNKKERIKNLKNSFAINKNAVKEKGVKNARVILVDDVITTGATLNEAAKTLKKAGFKSVIGITAARG